MVDYPEHYFPPEDDEPEEDVYRHDVLDEHGNIVPLSDAEKHVPRGSYVCGLCSAINPDREKAAVFFKSGPKIIPHWSHYPNSTCKSNESLIHKVTSEVLELHTAGELHMNYPGSNLISDVGDGYEFHEVVWTHHMDSAKRERVREDVMRGKYKIWIYPLKKINSDYRAILWKNYLHSGDTSAWYQELLRIRYEYRPRELSRGYNGDPWYKGAGDVIKEGVGHFETNFRICDKRCEYATCIESDGQPTLFTLCTLDNKFNEAEATNLCRFSLEVDYK